MARILTFFCVFSLLVFVPGQRLKAQGAWVGEGVDRQTPEEIARAKEIIARDFADAIELEKINAVRFKTIMAKYSYLDPDNLVPDDLLEQAVVYFDANKDKFKNQDYITIVDFKPRSDKSRLFLIRMSDGVVERYHTTHGVGSDPGKTGTATIFGNEINSGKSSLGFVRTAEVYSGTYKRALRLDGLSVTNSNMRERAVVFHGWDDVHEADQIQGWSWGCITLDWKVKDSVLDKIKDGSLLYAGVAK